MKKSKKRVEVVCGILLRRSSGKSPDQKWQVLLGKRKEHLSFAGLWEFPGGKVKPGESDENALIREFKEELSLTIKVGKFVLSSEIEDEQKHIIIRAYLVKPSGSNPRKSSLANSSEFELPAHSEIKFVTMKSKLDLKLVEGDIPIYRHLLKTLKTKDT